MEMCETGKEQVMTDIMINALQVPSGSPRTQGMNALRIAFGLCITPLVPSIKKGIISQLTAPFKMMDPWWRSRTSLFEPRLGVVSITHFPAQVECATSNEIRNTTMTNKGLHSLTYPNTILLLVSFFFLP